MSRKIPLYLLYFLFSFFSLAANAQMTISPNEYVTVWQLPAGVSTLRIPAGNTAAYTIRWENVSNPSSNGSVTVSAIANFYNLSFPSANATYRVAINSGNALFKMDMTYTNSADRSYLIKLEQWGSTKWSSFAYVCNGCDNLAITATDIPDLSNVITMYRAFAGCKALTTVPNMNNWDVSEVTAMIETFANAYKFNQDIGNWNTGKVTTMWGMFANALVFNQDLSNWNVESCTSMGTMFSYARVFNQNLGNWNLNASVSLNSMFNNSGMNCNNYSQTLAGWLANPITPTGRTLGATNLKYNEVGLAARTNLIGSKGWTFTGDVAAPVVAVALSPTVLTPQPLCYRSNAQIQITSSVAGLSYQLKDGTTNVGIAQNGNGGTLTFLTNNLTSNTNTYKIVATNAGGCTYKEAAVPAINVNALPSTLANNNEGRTCYVNGNNAFVEFISSSGAILAVNPGTQNLGNVTVTEYVDGTAQVVQACGTPDPYLASAALRRHWVISSQNAFATPVSVRLYVDNSDVSDYITVAGTTPNPLDNITAVSQLKLNKYNGPNENASFSDNCSGTTSWYPLSANNTMTGIGYPGPATGNYLTYSVPGFSELWLASRTNPNPLPVELTDLRATCQESGSVKVSWRTQSENNSESFVLQSSRDLLDWKNVSGISGAGNSTQAIDYALTDLERFPSDRYYRIIQRDFDGNSKTFGPVSASCTENIEKQVNILPNPASGSFSVAVNLEEEGMIFIEMMDLNGKNVFTQSIAGHVGMNVNTISAGNINQGTYLVKVSPGNVHLTPEKLVLIH